MKFLLPLLLLTVLVLPTTAAQAAKDQRTYFEAPRDLKDPSTMESALDQMNNLGVKAVRQVLYGRDVAPDANAATKPDFDTTDPAAYNWGQYDNIVNAVKARGWRLLLTVTGPVPKWATDSKKDQVTSPDPSEFAQFMTAVARHYGTKVDVWSIWNEPNQPQFLQPQFKNGKPYSPTLYRALYKGALKGFASAKLTPQVLFGETSPRGTGKVVAPLTFLRDALCVSTSYKFNKSCGKLAIISGIAHHAYTTRQGPFFVPPGKNDVTIGVLNRLVSAVDKIGRSGATPKGLPVWLTEFGIQSTPDPLYGVSLQTQAEYRSISEHLAYANSRIKSFSQYLLRDDDPIKGVSGSAKYGGFESGLETNTGKQKLAYDGFRLALVATKRSSTKVTLWGLVRPATAATPVTVQYRDGSSGAFKTLQTLNTNATGYISLSAAYKAHRQYRLQWTDVTNTTYDGAATRAYSAP